VDQKVLTQYLELTTPHEEVLECGMGEVVLKPCYSPTLQSYANPRAKAKYSNANNQFDHARTVPSAAQSKLILGNHHPQRLPGAPGSCKYVS
jgi:hypothetical protein